MDTLMDVGLIDWLVRFVDLDNLCSKVLGSMINLHSTFHHHHFFLHSRSHSSVSHGHVWPTAETLWWHDYPLDGGGLHVSLPCRGVRRLFLREFRVGLQGTFLEHHYPASSQLTLLIEWRIRKWVNRKVIHHSSNQSIDLAQQQWIKFRKQSRFLHLQRLHLSEDVAGATLMAGRN